MENVVLAYNGFPVCIITDRYSIQNDNYTDLGTLWKFVMSIEDNNYSITYFDKSDFKKDDQKKARSGYYRTESFYDYKNGDLPIDKLLYEMEVGWGYKHFLPTNDEGENSNWGLKVAAEGDLVRVYRLNPEPDFTYYYKNKEYKFKVKYPAGQNFPKAYKTVSDYPPVNPDPNSPDYSIIIPDDRDKNDMPTGIFYRKNFGDFITTWSELDDSKKEPLARAVVFICWKISWIEREISKFTVYSTEYIKTAYNNKYYNNDDTDYNELTLADRIVGTLLWQWGYYYSNDNGNIKFDLTPILPTQYSDEYIDALNQYYNALANFYNNIYYKDFAQLFPDDGGSVEERSARRVAVLIKIIPGIAVNVILVELRLEILDKIIEQKEIYEDDDKNINEADVLKILNSFTGYTEANKLLDFLAVIKTGSRTRYEILFKLMDDNRLERYPFISWFVDDANNCQYYNFLLYEKWKISKYNMYYIPTGVTPNDNGLNPDAFFLKPEGLKYFSKDGEVGGVELILEYSFEMVSSSIFNQIFNEISYEAEDTLEREMVVVNQKTVITSINSSFHGGGRSTFRRKYANYHIYQPIALIGYQSNIDFDVPQFAPIPSFLLFYSTDYNRLKTYDAIISFTAEVAIEIGLFFATGGVGAIRHLKHLKYLNKMGAAFRGTLPASEAVIVWRGAESGTEILSVSAGVLYSTTQFIANTTTSQETYELMQRLGKFFLVLTFTSAGGAIYSRQRAVRGADEVLEEIDRLNNLSPPVTVDLDSEVMDVILTIGNINQKITLMGNKIAGLNFGSGVSNNLLTKYNDASYFTRQEKYRFFSDYFNVNSQSVWVKLNETDAELLDIWKSVVTHKGFTKYVDFLVVVNKTYSSNRIDNHILKLDINIKPTGGVKVTGGHHYQSMLDNLPTGYQLELTDVSNLLLGFKRAKVRVNIPGIGWKVKGYSTLLPDFWDAQRIKEEIAYAWWKAGFPQTPQVGNYESFLSNGVRVKIIIKTDPVTGTNFLDNLLFFEYLQ